MYTEIKAALQGPVYTIFTPFADNEEVDYDVLESYLRGLYDRGARRFYAMAYNSRYSQMKHDEIMQLNGFCARTLKALDSDNIVIVGDPIHCSTAESTEFAIHARDAGADLISLIMREKYFTDEQVLEHFDSIGQASDFPILVHEMPFLSGADGSQMHWPVSLMQSLPKVAHIAALKEDAKDPDVTHAALALEPDIRIVIAGGGKATLRKYLEHGARAWLNGISIIDAAIAERFWRACHEDDTATQDFIIEQLEEPFFSSVVSKYGWHRCNKALLQAAGLMHRRDRMPLKHLDDSEFAEVQAVCDEVLRRWRGFCEQDQSAGAA